MLIREAEAIKSEMASVEARVSRSTKLLSSLSDERRRWEAGSGHFQQHMRTIAGDTLMAAAFLTYAGRFDFKQRRTMVNELRIMLDTVAAPCVTLGNTAGAQRHPSGLNTQCYFGFLVASPPPRLPCAPQVPPRAVAGGVPVHSGRPPGVERRHAAGRRPVREERHHPVALQPVPAGH